MTYVAFTQPYIVIGYLIGGNVHASARPDWQAKVLTSHPAHLSVRYQTCEDILKTNELILLQIGTSGRQGKGMKRSILGSWGQRSRLHEAEDKLGGLAEALFSTPLGLLDLLFMYLYAFYQCIACR